MDKDSDNIIGTIADVARYLRDEGFCAIGKDKPSKNSKKIYEDKGKGLLTAKDFKNITYDEVMSYVGKANLIKRSGAGSRSREIEDYSAEKSKEELNKLRIDTKIKELTYKKEAGLVVSREENDRKNAMKLAFLEAALKNFHRTRAIDWIKLVGGEIKKVQLYCEVVFSDIDDLMDQIARMDEIKVVLKRNMDGISNFVDGEK